MFAHFKIETGSKTGEINDLTIKPYKLEDKTTPFDVVLYASEFEPGAVNFKLMYSTVLFKRGTIERLIVHFVNIAREVSENPGIKISSIEMFSPGEEESFFHSSQKKIEGLEIDFDF